MSSNAQFTHAHMTRFDWPMPAERDKVWGLLMETRRLPPAGAASSTWSMPPRDRTVEPRETYMKRKAERYRVDLPQRPS
jgi:hypothetical protein